MVVHGVLNPLSPTQTDINAKPSSIKAVFAIRTLWYYVSLRFFFQGKPQVGYCFFGGISFIRTIAGLIVVNIGSEPFIIYATNQCEICVSIHHAIIRFVLHFTSASGHGSEQKIIEPGNPASFNFFASSYFTSLKNYPSCFGVGLFYLCLYETIDYLLLGFSYLCSTKDSL